MGGRMEIVFSHYVVKNKPWQFEEERKTKPDHPVRYSIQWKISPKYLSYCIWQLAHFPSTINLTA